MCLGSYNMKHLRWTGGEYCICLTWANHQAWGWNVAIFSWTWNRRTWSSSAAQQLVLCLHFLFEIHEATCCQTKLDSKSFVGGSAQEWREHESLNMHGLATSCQNESQINANEGSWTSELAKLQLSHEKLKISPVRTSILSWETLGNWTSELAKLQLSHEKLKKRAVWKSTFSCESEHLS